MGPGQRNKREIFRNHNIRSLTPSPGTLSEVKFEFSWAEIRRLLSVKGSSVDYVRTLLMTILTRDGGL